MKPDLLRESQRQQEQPRRDVVQQVLAGAGGGLADSHPSAAWQPLPLVQVDPHGGLAVGGGEVQPADARWRAGVHRDLAGQLDGTAPSPATEAHLVPGPLVVRRGELVNREYGEWPVHAVVLDPGRHELAARPHDYREPRAGRRQRVRQQVHLAADISAANRDHLAERDDAAGACLRSARSRRVGRRSVGGPGRRSHERQ